jgi:hypothetical protein
MKLYFLMILLLAIGVSAAPAYLTNQGTIDLFSSQGNLIEVGKSLQGKAIYLLDNGVVNPNGTKNLLVVRQHGVEYYASYVAFGMIKQSKVYKDCEIDMVINANPDGIDLKRGENSIGLNLNRLWNLPDNEAYETAINRLVVDGQSYTRIFDMHAYGGNEIVSEILSMDSKSYAFCKKNVFAPYKCKDTSAWPSPGTLREYSFQKGTPISLTIETRQNTWKNATRAELENIGKKLAWFICK